MLRNFTTSNTTQLASIVVVGDMTKEQIMPKLKFLNGGEQNINKNIPMLPIKGKTYLFMSGPPSIISLVHGD